MYNGGVCDPRVLVGTDKQTIHPQVERYFAHTFSRRFHGMIWFGLFVSSKYLFLAVGNMIHQCHNRARRILSLVPVTSNDVPDKQTKLYRSTIKNRKNLCLLKIKC